MTNSDHDSMGPTRVRVCAANLAFAEAGITIVDLATVDVLARGALASIDEGSVREAVSFDTFLAEAENADVLANAVAGTLRLRFTAPLPLMPWICLSKVAVAVSAGGDPPSLVRLTKAFEVEAELENRIKQSGMQGDAAAEMWATALVLAAMARSGCPIRRQLLVSQVITPPYVEIPALDDDLAWRYLPDDLLEGLHKCTHDLPDTVVARAWREKGRRRASGHMPDLKAINWRLPGVVPYGLGEVSAEE